MPPLYTHVSFMAGAEDPYLPVLEDARVNRYQVQSVVGSEKIFAGWNVARLETETPTELDAPFVLRGVTQHLHYTTKPERTDLVARSRAELPPSPDTTAVLIPIRKSAAWWTMAHDERGVHFHGDGQRPGHTAIGSPFVERIFRKLYHARYQGSPYDFLTYFEFHSADADYFRDLLRQLRDPALNPEWGYVEEEFEVWMTKTA